MTAVTPAPPAPAQAAAATLAADDQPGLPLWTALRLVRSGIGFRLVRSGITVSIQALAVAFLVFTVAGGMLNRHVAHEAAARLAPVTADRVALTRLSRPDPRAEVAARLAAGDVPAAYARWSGLDAAAWAAVEAEAQELAAAEAWLNGLGPAASAAVLGGRSPAAAATRLGDPEAAEAFAAAIDDLSPVDRDAMPVASAGRLVTLLTEAHGRVSSAIAAVADGHAAAVQALADRYPGRNLAAVVAEGSPGLAVELDRAGFDAGPLLAAAPEAQRLADAARLTEALQSPAARRAVARTLDAPAAAVDPGAALAFARDPADAAELAATLRAAGGATPPADRLLDLARSRAATSALAAVAGDADAGGGGRTALLLGLSALVCVVGIGNAMLMSVTERFGEIATMKCLGARAGSILRMYLLEALLLGVVGAAAGALLGVLLALLAAWASAGSLLALALPASGEVALAVLAAAAAGVALSAVAAVLPSLLAARLSPMEALRVE